MVALANNTELCLEGEVLSGLMSAKGYGFIMTSNGFNTRFWPKLIEHSYVAGPVPLLPSFQWKPRASAHGGEGKGQVPWEHTADGGRPRAQRQ